MAEALKEVETARDRQIRSLRAVGKTRLYTVNSGRPSASVDSLRW